MSRDLSRESVSRPFRVAALLALVPLAACGGGGGAEAFPSNPHTLQTLSGSVRASTGPALAGVRVSALGGALQSTTDASGLFVLKGALPVGKVPISFDGTLAPGGAFPELTVKAVLIGGDNALGQAVVLPDLSQGAAQPVATNASGATGSATALAILDDFAVSADAGMTVTLDGVPAVNQTVTLGLTSLAAIDLATPLPAAAVGQSFLSVEPWNAGFDTDGQGAGLDAELANPGLLPAGTELDIYWFDTENSVWVNRSVETGTRGVVVDHSGVARVDVTGLVTRGGLYAPALPLCEPCTWNLAGRVLSSGDAAPIAGAAVALSTGQFAQSDADGRFTITGVTGYDPTAALATPPVGTPTDVSISITLPAALGGTRTTDLIAAGTVLSGETLDTDFPVDVNDVGLISGRVEALAKAGLAAAVQLEPLDAQGPPKTVLPESDGSFFFSNLAVGGYQLSFAFPTESAVSGAEVETGLVSSVTLKEGAPSDALDVLVVLDADGDAATVATPQPGARVTALDANGTLRERTTDADGVARFFGLQEPLTLTAQFDFDPGSGLQRLGTTLVDVLPTDGVVGVPVRFESAPTFVVKDAMVQGTLSNVTLGATESVGIVVFAHGLPAEESAVSKLASVPGNQYTVNVPSGTPLTIVAVKSGLDGLAAVQVRELVLALGVPELTSGGTTTVDFDFAGAGLVSVDQFVAATFENQLAGAGFTEVSLLLSNGSDLEGRLPLALFPPSFGTGTVLVPDFGDPGLGGADAGLGAGGERSTKEYYCSLEFDATPTAVTFPLGSPALFTNPTSGQSATSDELAQMTVTTTGAAGGTPAGWEGVNFLHIGGSADLGLGVSSFAWSLWLPEDQESIALPATSWPMFVGGNSVDFELTRYRFESGQAFDSSTFFDQDVAAKLVGLATTLTGECESSAAVSVSVTSPTP